MGRVNMQARELALNLRAECIHYAEPHQLPLDIEKATALIAEHDALLVAGTLEQALAAVDQAYEDCDGWARARDVKAAIGALVPVNVQAALNNAVNEARLMCGVHHAIEMEKLRGEQERKLTEARRPLLEALQGIIEIGKRDMTNPKYDGYFQTAREAISQAQLEAEKARLTEEKK